MKKWLSKNYLIVIGMVSIAVIAIVLFIIGKENDSNVYSFWGSLLGGIIGGVATIIAFLVTSNQNKKESLVNRKLQIANIEYSIKKESLDIWYLQVETVTREILSEMYPYDICENLKSTFEQRNLDSAKSFLEKVNNVKRKIIIDYCLLFNLTIKLGSKNEISCTKEEDHNLFCFQNWFDSLNPALQKLIDIAAESLSVFRKNILDEENEFFTEIDKMFEAYYFETYQNLLKSAKKFLNEVKDFNNNELTKFLN